jgi:hypothetical protein
MLKRRTTLAGAGVLGLSVLLAVTLTGSRSAATSADARLTSLPGWTSPTAKSDVFAVVNTPVPKCSLDGGTLPNKSRCSDASYALRDLGVDMLIDEMERQGVYFHRTTTHADGLVPSDGVVVIKVNNQWGGQGSGSGRGRLATNTDVVKGLIWRILQHPFRFTGEIVVAENTQDWGPGWSVAPANAKDQKQSFRDVVDTFESLGYPVSLFSWDDMNYKLARGGTVGGSSHPTGEYILGDNNDAYILLEDPEGNGTDELSYPKFLTAGGNSVSMRYGVWNGFSYQADRLTLINVPVLKKHHLAGATISWKNLIGFITVANGEDRYGRSDTMHDFFFGYERGSNQKYGLVGRQLALIRAPDLNVVDAIWVATEHNSEGPAVRQDVLLASTDPFAVDWYASEYVLLPSVSQDIQGSSAARAGTFRSATLVNQNAAAAKWRGGKYPYMDLSSTHLGNTPIDSEKKQMNVFVVDGRKQ